jgi:hypothetical protein
MENKKPEVTTENVALSSPWMTYYKKLVALFGDDPELNVLWNDDTKSITIESTNTFKIMALEKLLNPVVTFGNITVTVSCRVKDGAEESLSAIFKTAFAGNPHFKGIIEKKVVAMDETFVLFKNEVIQFFNDDTTDYYGNWNGLSEDIMRDIIKKDIRVNIGTAKPLNSFVRECDPNTPTAGL